jgi:ribose/xylose/arabinose/galactoside ABC-type transport system permease subunit
VNTPTAPTLDVGSAPSKLVTAAADFGRAHKSRIALIGVILGLVAFTATQSDVFLTWANLENVLVQISITGIIAGGMTVLMVSGGIDLSVGSTVSLAGVVLGTLMAGGMAPIPAIGIGIGVAVAVGAVAGTLAANTTSHPFIVTLGLLTLVQGLALLVTQTPISDLDPGFLDLSSKTVLGLPLVVFVFAVVMLFVHIVLTRTSFGRWLFAIGASESAARLAGIRVRLIKVAAYSLSGVLVGIAAVLLTTQLSSAQPRAGAGLELTAIAAVAVGGTPLAGGRGGIPGTLLGLLLLGLIGNALNLMSIASDWQFVLQGAVIILAVMAQRGD